MEIQIGDSADRVSRGLTGLLLCYLGMILHSMNRQNPIEVAELLKGDNSEEAFSQLVREHAKKGVSGVLPKFLDTAQKKTGGPGTAQQGFIAGPRPHYQRIIQQASVRNCQRTFVRAGGSASCRKRENPTLRGGHIPRKTLDAVDDARRRVVRVSCLSYSLTEVVRLARRSSIPGGLRSASQCFFRDIEHQMTVLRHRLRNAK